MPMQRKDSTPPPPPSCGAGGFLWPPVVEEVPSAVSRGESVTAAVVAFAADRMSREVFDDTEASKRPEEARDPR